MDDFANLEVEKMNYSPLRYPGGKAKFSPCVKEIIHKSKDEIETYIEPFAGGAGVALDLLFSGEVKRIVINDYYKADKNIANQEVFVAIRPEGFTLTNDTSEVLNAEAEMVQVLGRDISVIGKNSECLTATFKVIIQHTENSLVGPIKLKVSPNKLFIFDINTQERIYLD